LDFHAVIAKSALMARRPLIFFLLLALAGLGISGAVFAQLESADRGILPLDSSGTLEVTGIKVDVGGKDAENARYNGWRMAQRIGFKLLWSKAHGQPPSAAPNLSDSALDGLVSSIIVEDSQMGPNRYIATLGVQFDRARAGAILGISGQQRRSAPMLLIPIFTTAGTATTVELRNPWQRAWAQFRTSQSPIDYVRPSGLGIDPLLVNAAQVRRPGRGWWRNIVDYYGAADILVAEVQMHRLYPGGPATAHFIGRHGPDGEFVGEFDLTARDSAGIPAMMEEGVRRMDALFTQAFETGGLVRDNSLDSPEPPPLPQVVEEEKPKAPQQAAYAYQVQISSKAINVYNFAMAHLRTLPGIDQVDPIVINPTGTSYITVTYRGSAAQLAAALAGRGWSTDSAGTVVRMSGGEGAPPPLPVAPKPTHPAPAKPAQPQPSALPQPATPAPGGRERRRKPTRSHSRSTGPRRTGKPASSSRTPIAKPSTISANGACGRSRRLS
jgi:hypothetical protein